MIPAIQNINQWREQFNPLRGLTIARAVSLLEAWPRGEMADLQWTYFFIEQTDPDLFALLDRRTSALQEMDWDIRTKDKSPEAGRQAGLLRAAYDSIENIYEAIGHLASASFRGFAHCEKIADAAGRITELRIVDQWNVVRNGLSGDWKYNPKADSVGFLSLGKDMLMRPEQFLIRTVDRHINRIALIKFIRSNLCEKDWDGFVEIYGIPGGVVIMPPNVPEEKELEYQASAEEIAKGGSGALPNGSDYKANTDPRGNSPFKERLNHLSEKLILVGTGGKLTMLTEGGSGTLAGGAHADTFKSIARAEARQISEIFQRQIDKAILAAAGVSGKPLAWFEIAGREETDTGAFVKDVQLLSQAGYQVAADQINEKTGYQVQLTKDDIRMTIPPRTNRQSTIVNRKSTDPEWLGSLMASARIGLAGAVDADLQPLRDALSKALQSHDGDLAGKLAALKKQLPDLLRQIAEKPRTADEIEAILGAGAASGLTEKGNP